MISTTLVRLVDDRIKLGRVHELWTTLEGENPGGSIKDRMVEPELLQLKNSDTVSEISAGSTALSLAYYSQKLGFRCRLFVPLNIDTSLKKKLTDYGADLTECEPSKAYQDYEIFCQSSRAWRFDQMQRKELRLHYSKWGKEQLAPFLPALDFVIGAVGTGHSLLGIKTALNPKFGCIVAEPKPGQSVHGVRNLTEQSFGAADPCELNLIERRIETEPDLYFNDHKIKTDHGQILISDSFRLTLGAALSHLDKIDRPLKVFLVGSHCKYM